MWESYVAGKVYIQNSEMDVGYGSDAITDLNNPSNAINTFDGEATNAPNTDKVFGKVFSSVYGQYGAQLAITRARNNPQYRYKRDNAWEEWQNLVTSGDLKLSPEVKKLSVFGNDKISFQVENNSNGKQYNVSFNSSGITFTEFDGTKWDTLWTK